MASSHVNERGVTFIEIMLVLVIAALVAATTVPKMVRAYRQHATISAVDRFVRAHELARAMAVRYSRVAQLHIDATGGRFWVDVDTSGTGVRATIGAIRSLADLGVSMTSPDTLMCIDARGLPSTSNSLCQSPAGTLFFSSSGRSDSVTITLLGKVLR